MQRGSKLETHMQSLKDLDLVLEELLQWLIGLENTLLCEYKIFLFLNSEVTLRQFFLLIIVGNLRYCTQMSRGCHTMKKMCLLLS